MAVVDSAVPVEAITATLVPQNKRMLMLPKHFGSWQMKAEDSAVQIARHMAERTYSKCSGYWDYFETSNNGFFASPFNFESEVVMDSPNQSQHTLGGEAAGLVIWMMLSSHLSFEAYHSDSQDMTEAFTGNFHQLREFALNHKDATAIFGLLD